MSRIVLWVMSTLTVLVLLFGYHTSTSSAPSSGSVLASPAQPGAVVSGGTTATEGGTASATAITVTGPSVDTRWGPVQVQITVDNGTVTGVDVVEYPSGNGKDQQINARALPVLVSETLRAQSANIDMVSGATVTSEGYTQSLQGALDQAGL
jgi:uncharacterized protein with FMN-binding domain